MRSSTVEKTVIAIEAIRDHFKTDIINTKQLNSFKENRPEVYIPVAFYHNCKTERATYDLNKFNADAISEQTQVGKVVAEILNPVVEETDEEIEARIDARFHVMDMMVTAAINGNCRSLIVSGAPGTGKSYSTLNAVSNMPEEKVSVLSGKVSPVGLFRTLWKHRFDNHVIIFDDCDSIFDNETSMNLLKAACDSSDERYITWASNTKQVDEEGEEIPSTFEFNGAVVVLTNIDFKAQIQKDNAMSPHFSAMMSRSHFVDLAIKTQREYMVRIKSVVYKSGMLNEYSERTRDEVVQFIDMNKNSMNELSLRMVKKVADLTRISPDDWRMVASITVMK